MGKRNLKLTETKIATMKMTEEQLAAKIISYLKDYPYEIYQEVSMGMWNPTTDIVATDGRIQWAIECKMTLTFQVLAQASANRCYFHYSSIAVPALKKRAFGARDNGREFAIEIARDYGIGVFLWHKEYSDEYIEERVKPGLFRKARSVYLNDAQKSFAKAGNSQGYRWTPFQETKKELIEYITKHPGCRIKDAVEEIDHHYHSNKAAASSLPQWIRRGVIKEIWSDRGKLFLTQTFPTTA